MEHNISLKANSFLASQEIHRNLWKPKVHYLVQKSTQFVSILSQINPLPSAFHFLYSHFNLIFPHMLSGPFSSGFPTKILYAHFLPSIRATCSNPLILHLTIGNIFGEKQRS